MDKIKSVRGGWYGSNKNVNWSCEVLAQNKNLILRYIF